MGALPDSHLHVLIMAGGSGTRFWPRSRRDRPKQLLALWDDKTLLEHTVQRFAPLVSQENTWIVTTQALVQASQAVLAKRFSNVKFLGEPMGKNTAACILWGILEIQKKDPNAVVAVMAADHFIADEPLFLQAVRAAVSEARENHSIITLGIRPSRPETGYGYIEFERAEKPANPTFPAHSVKQFVEKPDLRTAVRYVESGKYLWNAGMFILSAKTGLDAFEKCMPSLFEILAKDKNAVIAERYAKIGQEEAVSIDYGVMEVAAEHGVKVSVVPLDCGWNDVGSFVALEDINCSIKGEVVSLEAPCNVVQTDSGVIALLGVNDLVVVRDRDVVLVASKERAQDIKSLLEKVRQKHPELL